MPGLNLVSYCGTPSQVPFRPSDPILLQVPQVHDRAHIFVNEIYRATLSRMDVISSTPLSDLRFNDTLALFVENQGHTCCSENPPEQKVRTASSTSTVVYMFAFLEALDVPTGQLLWSELLLNGFRLSLSPRWPIFVLPQTI